ncbi:MAG: hypothetical protein JXA94_00915 [Parachlamydiales bacterium]|nr:hypothetical protein [Parachlamydiales bacterium]
MKLFVKKQTEAYKILFVYRIKKGQAMSCNTVSKFSFLEKIISKNNNPFSIPHAAWGLNEWDTLSEEEITKLLFPFIKFQLKRAKNTMDIYKEAYKDINLDDINNIEDFHQIIPFLVKDSTIVNKGFRNKVKHNPYCLLPSDIKKPTYTYKSGGTKGVATPTFNTKDDLMREAYSFTRAFRYEGFTPKDIALCTYNSTHKGGEVLKEALQLSGINYIPRRTNETAKDLIEMIKTYKINILMTTQGPLNKEEKEGKGGGIDLFSLINEGQDLIEKYIKIVWLGGYKLIDEVISWAKAFNIKLVNAYGACEAMALGTSSLIENDKYICQYNNIHLLQGPHYIEVVRYENDKLIKCKKGETGMLAYTTVAREGTIYIRYLIGDQATIIADEGECPCKIHSKVISNIQRIDHPEDVISAGCMCSIG